MPDLAEKEIVTWPEELCASCLKLEDCPFVSSIQTLGIVFFRGCRVWMCKRYEGDESSPHYIPDSERRPLETAKAELREKIARYNEATKG